MVCMASDRRDFAKCVVDVNGSIAFGLMSTFPWRDDRIPVVPSPLVKLRDACIMVTAAVIHVIIETALRTMQQLIDHHSVR